MSEIDSKRLAGRIRAVALVALVILIGAALLFQRREPTPPLTRISSAAAVVPGAAQKAPPLSALERQAAAELAALAIGPVSDLQEMAGLRERAVCGRVGSRRVIYRPDMPEGRRATVEGSPAWPQETFALLWPNWCVENDNSRKAD